MHQYFRFFNITIKELKPISKERSVNLTIYGGIWEFLKNSPIFEKITVFFKFFAAVSISNNFLWIGTYSIESKKKTAIRISQSSVASGRGFQNQGEQKSSKTKFQKFLQPRNFWKSRNLAFSMKSHNLTCE